jgi:NAD(P)-dependent dehydrogenase (short-subunit alcohol dehydrogenase family)
VWTPLQVTGGQTEENLAKFGQETPMGRPGQPAELAPLYVLLASEDSSYSTARSSPPSAATAGRSTSVVPTERSEWRDPFSTISRNS